MPLKSTSIRYGAVAIGIHWLSALLIIVTIVVGLMASQIDDPVQKAAILRFHAPGGLAVLVLTLARIVWWLAADKKPAAPAGQSAWQTRISRWVHRSFYGAILVMVGSGIWLMIASEVGEVIFRGSTKQMPEFDTFAAYRVHSTMALVLEALLVLHVVAALYHQFVRKDRLLARMGMGR